MNQLEQTGESAYLVTLGVLHESIAKFSSHESIPEFWFEVIRQAKWMVRSERMMVLRPRADGRFVVEAAISEGERDGSLSHLELERFHLIKKKHQQKSAFLESLEVTPLAECFRCVGEPARTAQTQVDSLKKWFTEKPCTGFIVAPIFFEKEELGWLLFSVKEQLAEEEEKLVKSVLSVYSRHAAMTCRFLKTHQELKNSKESLTEKNEQLVRTKNYIEKIFESLSEMVFVLDQNETVETVNRAVLKILGYEAREMVGQKIRRFIQRVALSANNEIQDSSAGEIRTHGFAKDGSEIPLLLTTTTVVDESGGLTHVIVSAKDARESRLLKELQDSEKELQELALFPRLNPEPVVRIDRDGEILLINPAAEKLFCIEGNTNRKWFGICPSDKRKEIDCLFDHDGLVLEVVDVGQRLFRLLYTSIPNVQTVNVFGFEVTELVQAQKALEQHRQNLEAAVDERTAKLREAQAQLVQSGKLAALGEMSSGVAHELNNPLHFIKGFNNRIQAAFEGDRAVQFDEVSVFIKKVNENCERMRRIVNHFREFSRQADHQMVPLSINETVLRSFVLLSEQLRLHGISVTQELCEENPIVLGDGNRLEQVFINLLNNARDAFSGQNKKDNEIVVSTALKGQSVVIEFKDNGCGISKDKQDKVFNPFFTTKEVGIGTGLGLSISHGIISEHKGKISCFSEEGAGTRFEIVLDLFDERSSKKPA